MSEPVRVHLRVPGTAPMPELMRLIQSIEAAGFDGAGILDSQMISRDTFVDARPGRDAHLAADAVPGGHQPVHPPRLGAGRRDPDGGGAGAGPREVRDRHRLHLGQHHRPQAGHARRDARVHRHGARRCWPARACDFDGTPGGSGYAAGRPDPGHDGRLGAQGDRGGRRGRRRRAAAGRLQPRHRRDARSSYLERGRQARGTAARGPGDHLGGAHRHGGDHRRGAPAGAADRRALGHPALGRLLAGAGRAEDPAAGDPGRGASRSIPISRTRTTGRRPSRPRRSSPTRSSPSCATRSA